MLLAGLGAKEGIASVTAWKLSKGFGVLAVSCPPVEQASKSLVSSRSQKLELQVSGCWSNNEYPCMLPSVFWSCVPGAETSEERDLCGIFLQGMFWKNRNQEVSESVPRSYFLSPPQISYPVSHSCSPGMVELWVSFGPWLAGYGYANKVRNGTNQRRAVKNFHWFQLLMTGLEASACCIPSLVLGIVWVTFLLMW